MHVFDQDVRVREEIQVPLKIVLAIVGFEQVVVLSELPEDRAFESIVDDPAELGDLQRLLDLFKHGVDHLLIQRLFRFVSGLIGPSRSERTIRYVYFGQGRWVLAL